MSKKNKEKKETVEETVTPEKEPVEETPAAEAPAEEAPKEPEKEAPKEESELEKAQAALAKEHDQYLRLAAEYDNFRKRSRKEKEALYTDVKAETAAKFLPVYDNLERALKAETADESYKKGVEMTFNQLMDVFKKLGVEEIESVGKTFDPNLHNAVMHVEDESLGANVITEVFQKGYKLKDKVLRPAMVKTAN